MFTGLAGPPIDPDPALATAAAPAGRPPAEVRSAPEDAREAAPPPPEPQGGRAPEDARDAPPAAPGEARAVGAAAAAAPACPSDDDRRAAGAAGRSIFSNPLSGSGAEAPAGAGKKGSMAFWTTSSITRGSRSERYRPARKSAGLVFTSISTTFEGRERRELVLTCVQESKGRAEHASPMPRPCPAPLQASHLPLGVNHEVQPQQLKAELQVLRVELVHRVPEQLPHALPDLRPDSAPEVHRAPERRLQLLQVELAVVLVSSIVVLQLLDRVVGEVRGPGQRRRRRAKGGVEGR